MTGSRRDPIAEISRLADALEAHEPTSPFPLTEEDVAAVKLLSNWVRHLASLHWLYLKGRWVAVFLLFLLTQWTTLAQKVQDILGFLRGGP